jgi:hypothetical protein
MPRRTSAQDPQQEWETLFLMDGGIVLRYLRPPPGKPSLLMTFTILVGKKGTQRIQIRNDGAWIEVMAGVWWPYGSKLLHLPRPERP